MKHRQMSVAMAERQGVENLSVSCGRVTDLMNDNDIPKTVGEIDFFGRFEKAYSK